MHRIAEQGIAAHWKYKEGRKDGQEDQHIAWLRHLLEWIQEMRDPGEFMSTLKVDLYREEVYTFTPRGKVIVLPREATPIDFAYAIHTAVGHVAWRQDQWPHRSTQVRAAQRDVVEILTQPGHMPSKDWLALVKTRGRATDQSVINRHRARQGHRDRREIPGERGAAPRRIASKVTKADLERVASEYGFAKARICTPAGLRQVLPRKVLAEDFTGNRRPGTRSRARAGGSAQAGGAPPGGPGCGRSGDPRQGMDDLLVYRAKCAIQSAARPSWAT